MTEERQPNTEPPYAPTPKCPLGDHLVFVWPDSGKIVPHYGDDGLKCPASYTVHPNVTTKPTEPNTELRELSNEMLLTNFRWACKNWLKDEQYEPLRAEILRRMEKQ